MALVALDDVHVRALTDADRAEIAMWRYPGELALYSPGEGAFDLHEPDHVALTSPGGALIGYGTLGAEARVPGGRYEPDEAVTDVGLGLRPDLVGAGYGAAALRALMAWAEQQRSATRFRATVAAANARATGLVLGLGFVSSHRFRRPRDDREFVQYERDAG